MSTQVALPQDRFGVTQVRYNLPQLPRDLPERPLLEAANNLNEHRHYNLTAKQRLFVDEYFRNGLDEAQAAIASGYAQSEEEARRVGRKLLRTEYVRKAVDLAFDYYRESSKISFNEVVGEIKRIAFANMGDYWSNDGNDEPALRMPSDDERDLLAAISEITVDTYKEGRGQDAREVKRVKFKLYDKLAALEKLLKILNVKGIAEPEPAATNVQVNATSNVSVINLVPVPAGQFVPAPPRPDLLAVNHAPTIEMSLKQPESA